MKPVSAMALLFLGGCTCAASHVTDAGGVAVDAGPPRIDAGTDAGYDAAIPPDAAPVTDCLEAFAAVPGTPCLFEGACLAGDLCCSANAVCWDGRVNYAYLPPDCAGDPRPTACVGEPGEAHGSTPAGPLDLTSVHVSFTFAFAVDALIVFTPGPELVVCDGDRLSVWLVPHMDDSRFGYTYVGTHDAVAQRVVGGVVERAPAVVEITAYDDSSVDPEGRLAGTVRVDAPGWDVTGRFDARGCDDVNRSGP